MYAQLTYFDGPRSPELIAAMERANRERIEPAILARPDLRDDLVAAHTLRRPDGGEIVLVIVQHEDSLDKAFEVVMGTELRPGEDPALLPGPDRVERYEVVRTIAAPSTATAASTATTART